MRELVFRGPGDVGWAEAFEPALVPAGALVRPIAVATCDLDVALLRGLAPAPTAPFALGHEFVAVVVDVGDEVTSVTAGELVCVPFQISCGSCMRCVAGHTARCQSSPGLPMYGLGSFGGEWGGAFADALLVPYADAMLVRAPDDIPVEALPALSDNLVDGYRTVAAPLGDLPGADVVVFGGLAASVGLYAVACARALGAGAVHYVDADDGRRSQAAGLGAVPLDTGARVPRAPITVDASGLAAGLQAALDSTDVEGVCTSASMFFSPVELTLTGSYTRGVRIVTGRPHARTLMPEVLQLVRTGVLDPLALGAEVARWDDAPDMLARPPDKAVFLRDR